MISDPSISRQHCITLRFLSNKLVGISEPLGESEYVQRSVDGRRGLVTIWMKVAECTEEWTNMSTVFEATARWLASSPQ